MIRSFVSNRRQFLNASLASTTLAIGGIPRFGEPIPTSQDLQWQNVKDWGIEGRGFKDTANYFDRLPARAKDIVRKPVWDLSRRSTGMSTRFKTDSKLIHVRYKLTSNRLNMPHMPATSVSGVDLYARNNENEWRWAAVAKPARQQVDTRLARNIEPLSGGKPREFMLYLPLFNGIESLEIGVAADAVFENVAPRSTKPIVFYGTSIMNGACATRSGMCISAIVGRRLNQPTINLGFSGNGKMEQSVGQFLCELDPSVFAIDCLPNMGGSLVTERCRPLVEQLRAARPDVPILLVEDRINDNAWLDRGRRKHHQQNHFALRRAYEEMLADGFKNLYYMPGADLLGDDGEATTDGSHPNDMGMVRYADHYERALRPILNL